MGPPDLALGSFLLENLLSSRRPGSWRVSHPGSHHPGEGHKSVLGGFLDKMIRAHDVVYFMEFQQKKTDFRHNWVDDFPNFPQVGYVTFLENIPNFISYFFTNYMPRCCFCLIALDLICFYLLDWDSTGDEDNLPSREQRVVQNGEAENEISQRSEIP